MRPSVRASVTSEKLYAVFCKVRHTATQLFGRHGRTHRRTHRFSRISESSGPILGDLKRALPSKKLSFWGPFKNTKKLNKRRLRAHTPILASLGKLRLRRKYQEISIFSNSQGRQNCSLTNFFLPSKVEKYVNTKTSGEYVFYLPR